MYRYLAKDLQHKDGYGQAVDLWSIGCVAATILTSDSFFADVDEWRTGSMTLSEIHERLTVLEVDRKWEHIGHRAKSLIRGCLTLDEDRRLTAEQCLTLPWFQHPYYKADFDAAYKHAISDWAPRELDDDVIQFIDTRTLVPESQSDDEETPSRHFEPAQEPSAREPSIDMASNMARFRPIENHQLHASPIRIPDSLIDSFEDVVDDVERNLSLASQNTAANKRAALQIHARQPPPIKQRRRI